MNTETKDQDSFVIKLSGVNFSYNSYQALNNIDLNVRHGAYLGVVGPNGSGKTTLAYIMAGILRPTTGTVETFGNNVGLVLTNPENQIVSLVVEDDIAFGPENLGLDAQQILDRVERSLKITGCPELRKSLVTILSGGQIAKVAFAGQLAMDAEIIILDEGTALMDSKAKSTLLDFLRFLNTEQSKTIIHISHKLDDLYAADEVVFLLGGEIKAKAPGALELLRYFKDTVGAYVRPGSFLLYRSFLEEMGLGDMDDRQATHGLVQGMAWRQAKNNGRNRGL